MNDLTAWIRSDPYRSPNASTRVWPEVVVDVSLADSKRPQWFSEYNVKTMFLLHVILLQCCDHLILLMQKLYMRSACRFVQKCPRKNIRTKNTILSGCILYLVCGLVICIVLFYTKPLGLEWTDLVSRWWWWLVQCRCILFMDHAYIYMLWIIHMPEVYILCIFFYRYKGSKYGTNCSSLRHQVTSSEVCAMFIRSTLGICVSEQRHGLGFDMADKKTPLEKNMNILFTCVVSGISVSISFSASEIISIFRVMNISAGPPKLCRSLYLFRCIKVNKGGWAILHSSYPRIHIYIYIYTYIWYNYAHTCIYRHMTSVPFRMSTHSEWFWFC